MSEWISVKDRLPEDGSTVLCTCFEYNNTNLPRVYAVLLYRDGFRWYNHGVDEWSSDTTNYITHWMPLPEPPKDK